MSAMPVILFLDHLPNIRKNQTQYGHGHEILAVCPDVHFNTIDLVPRGYGERHVFIRPGSNENMSFTVTPRHEIDGVEMDIGTDRKDFMTMSILGLIFSYIRQVIKK